VRHAVVLDEVLDAQVHVVDGPVVVGPPDQRARVVGRFEHDRVGVVLGQLGPDLVVGRHAEIVSLPALEHHLDAGVVLVVAAVEAHGPDADVVVEQQSTFIERVQDGSARRVDVTDWKAEVTQVPLPIPELDDLDAPAPGGQPWDLLALNDSSNALAEGLVLDAAGEAAAGQRVPAAL